MKFVIAALSMVGASVVVAMVGPWRSALRSEAGCTRFHASTFRGRHVQLLSGC
jgi:hypothetical protein